MASLTRTVAPSASLHTLAELKAHLRVDVSDEDALIAALGEAAEARLDGRDGLLGRCLVTQTWALARPAPTQPREIVRLPLAPVQSVGSVEVHDAAGALVAVSGWRLIGADGDPALEPTADWPDTDGRAEAMVVTFTAGYGDPSDVPAAIRAAALLIVGTLYEHREDEMADGGFGQLSLGARALIAPYRRIYR